jgi:DNA-binding response OmpR family regulator
MELSANGTSFVVSKFKNTKLYNFAFLLIPLLFFIGFIGYTFQKKSRGEIDPNLIPIGTSWFDKRNMVLLFGDEKVELSHKEGELLSLLYDSANLPVEREEILKKIWGDDGDYVGRTLDVFISKLRKKLEAEGNVKIVNIRGVGYKLLLAVPK